MSNNRNNREYNYYYGIPHAHTSYSDGAKTPYDAYKFARKNKIDFLIITEHIGPLIKSKSPFIDNSSNGVKVSPRWEMLKKEAKKINKKYKDFAALTGFELNTKFWGHINIFNSEKLIDKKRRNSSDLYKWLCENNDVILSINHPCFSSKKLSYSNEYDKYINLFEVCHGSPPNKYIRSINLYYKALDDGWHIGALNGQDNHIENWGDSENLTVVISEKLSPSSILDAFKMRRVYSTESKTLKLNVKANDKWMGSIVEINDGDSLNFEISANDIKHAIEKVEIITNGGKTLLGKKQEGINTVNLSFSYTPLLPQSWYVVKIEEEGGRIAISSAIFVNKK